MIKKLLTGIFTALALGSVISVTAMADDTAADTISIDGSGSITLTSEDSGQNKSTAVKLSLIVEPEEAANVAFDFGSANGVKVTDYRYHEDTKLLNIYIADSEPIFKNSASLDIGAVTVKDSDGNDVDFTVDLTEDSLQFVSKNTLTKQTVKVENELSPPDTSTDIPNKPLGSGDSVEVVATETTTVSETSETTTTTTTTANKSLDLKKTFPDSYIITIPTGTDSLKENQTFDVSAENVTIEHGKKLKLSVSSGYEWHLKDKYHTENKSGVKYEMGYGSSKTAIKENSETILTIGDGKKSDSVQLTVLSVDTPDIAGTFHDTLTFEIKIEN